MGEVIDRPENRLGKKRALFFMYVAQRQIRRLRLLALGACPGPVSVQWREQPIFSFLLLAGTESIVQAKIVALIDTCWYLCIATGVAPYS